MHRQLLLSAALLSTAVAAPGFVLAQDKSSELHAVMSKSMQEMQSMQMTGDLDKDFAMMMKHHHESGIEMARVQARNGKDPELRRQAQKSMEAQKKELAELDQWLRGKGSSQRSEGRAPAASGGSNQPDSSRHTGHGSK